MQYHLYGNISDRCITCVIVYFLTINVVMYILYCSNQLICGPTNMYPINTYCLGVSINYDMCSQNFNLPSVAISYSKMPNDQLRGAHRSKFRLVFHS